MASRAGNTELAATRRQCLKRGTIRSIRRFRSEMEEIREGQKKIEEGQKEVRGRSQQQKGKRKSDRELAKNLKKMKEGIQQVLKNLDKDVARLRNIVENQENLMDDLLHQLQLGYEELEQLNEKFAILCPDPNWDVYMSGTEESVDIISLLKYRSQMLDGRIQILYEMVFKLL